MATVSRLNSRTDVSINDASPRRPVNLRSVILGLAGVLFICAISPYNDYALNNTFLVGNFLPIGLLMFFVLFVAIVNAPLWRWAPQHVFGSGELAVALAMVLVSCTLPSSGLMRYLPGMLVGLPERAGVDAELRSVLESLHLPNWMFPKFAEDAWLSRSNDPIVKDYWGRAPVEDDTFLARIMAVPWRAWARPAVAWGLLLAALYGAILFGSIIVRRQWVENERLPFPLASVYLSLIDPPEKGKAYNAMFRAPTFWVAFAVPFVIHSLNTLHAYMPARVPELPIGYDFRALMTDSPWKYADWGFHSSRISFVVLGMSYFLQSDVAFSLWIFYLFINAARMIYGVQGSEFTAEAQAEEQIGAGIVFAAVILWTGRLHWALVLRHMLARVRPDDEPGRYVPYALAGWGFIACAAGFIAWLVAAGASVVGAVVIAVIMFLLFLVLARMAAETGMLFISVRIRMNRPWLYAVSEMPALLTARTTMRSHFWTNMFTWLFTNDVRASLPVYSTHALKVADDAGYGSGTGGGWRRAMPFVGCLALALAIGYVVAGASTLYVEYSHAVTLDARQASPINNSGWESAKAVLENTRAFEPPRIGPTESHHRWGHLLFGAGLTAALVVTRLTFVGFLLHPVGFLMANSYGMRVCWVSVFIGWMMKVLVVRFGGSELFRRSKPLFMGLIFGECGAAAFWLVVNMIMAAMGISYINSRLLPG